MHFALCFLLLCLAQVQARPPKKKYNHYYHEPRTSDQGMAGSWVELFDVMQQVQPNYQPVVVPQPTPPGPQLHETICGKRPVLGEGPSTRIIGGEKAELGEFPWQVSLLKTSVAGGKSVLTCGGALISARSVLTASHCLKLSPDRYEVWVGRMSSVVGVDECHDQKFRVLEIYKHPDFDPNTLQNDVAVLSIISTYGQGVRWTDWVLPACLPAPHHPALYFPGNKGVVSGWGLLDEHDKYMSPNLQHVKVPLMSHAACQAAYQSLTTLVDTQLCAGVGEGGKDACAGDSGGPLAVQDVGSERWYVVGVVSFGMGCGRAEYPGVYTRVEKFVTWVLDNVARIEGGRTQPKKLAEPMQQSVPIPITTTTTKTITTTRSTTTTLRTTTTMRTTTTVRTTTTTTPPPPIPMPSPTKHELGPVCQGYYRYASCKTPGTAIRVTGASFGRQVGNSACLGYMFPYYFGRRSCALPSARGDLARACDGKRSCRVTTRVGAGRIFSRNPCVVQRPYVMMKYVCESPSNGMQRTFSGEDDYIMEEAEERHEMIMMMRAFSDDEDIIEEAEEGLDVEYEEISEIPELPDNRMYARL